MTRNHTRNRRVYQSEKIRSMASGTTPIAQWLNAILLSAQIVNEMPPPKTKHESVRKKWTAKMVQKHAPTTKRKRGTVGEDET